MNKLMNIPKWFFLICLLNIALNSMSCSILNSTSLSSKNFYEQTAVYENGNIVFKFKFINSYHDILDYSLEKQTVGDHSEYIFFLKGKHLSGKYTKEDVDKMRSKSISVVNGIVYVKLPVQDYIVGKDKLYYHDNWERKEVHVR